MNDDLPFQLRVSWREFDVADSEQASVGFEQHRHNQAASRSLIDQATGIVMSAHDSDRERAEQVLARISDASGVTLTDLARAVVDVATGATTRADVEAAQLALRLLPGIAHPETDATTQSRRRRLVDLRDAAAAPPVA